MSFIPGHLNLDDIVFTLRMTSYQFVEEQQGDRLYIRVIPSELAPGHIIDYNPCHWLRLRSFLSGTDQIHLLARSGTTADNTVVVFKVTVTGRRSDPIWTSDPVIYVQQSSITISE